MRPQSKVCSQDFSAQQTLACFLPLEKTQVGRKADEPRSRRFRTRAPSDLLCIREKPYAKPRRFRRSWNNTHTVASVHGIQKRRRRWLERYRRSASRWAAGAGSSTSMLSISVWFRPRGDAVWCPRMKKPAVVLHAFRSQCPTRNTHTEPRGTLFSPPSLLFPQKHTQASSCKHTHTHTTSPANKHAHRQHTHTQTCSSSPGDVEADGGGAREKRGDAREGCDVAVHCRPHTQCRHPHAAPRHHRSLSCLPGRKKTGRCGGGWRVPEGFSKSVL